MESHYQTIATMINNAPHESVFVASDFADIADINTIRQCLSRLEQSGKITRIIRGLYYQPAYSKILNEYEAPSPHHIAEALARKYNWTIAPFGPTALNRLGLSTQVPARWSYISDGPYNSFTIGKIEIEFKHRNNKEISGLSPMTALVIQALRELGKDRIDDHTIQRLKRMLTDDQKSALLSEAKQTTSWIYSYIKKICKED